MDQLDRKTDLPAALHQKVDYTATPAIALTYLGAATLAVILLCLSFIRFELYLPFTLAPLQAAAAAAAIACVLCVLALLLARRAGRAAIELDEESITFPASFAPELLFRRRRSWDDISQVLVGSLMPDNRPQLYDYELETKGRKQHLVLYFRSGGHALIDLKRLTKAGKERIFLALETRCMDLSRAPKVRARDDVDMAAPTAAGRTGEEAAPMSYTELWEKEMDEHFSATNFVPLKKGAKLMDGKLRIIMQLSSGGLTAVYLAETDGKELRVVKEAALPPSLKESAREKARQLFRREASLLQELRHDQIARVYDHFVENGRDYLLLAFVPGKTLREIVRQSGPLDEQTVLRYMLDLTDPIAYLHDRIPPVIHRDITPDNIVLREDGRVVLIDFGAANLYLGTATGTTVGKQAYISPEQFRGKAEPASDIYAVGASMFFLVTGEDAEPLSTSSPRELLAELSPGIDALVQRCTALEAKERPASAEELAGQLRELLEEGSHSIDLSEMGAS